MVGIEMLLESYLISLALASLEFLEIFVHLPIAVAMAQAGGNVERHSSPITLYRGQKSTSHETSSTSQAHGPPVSLTNANVHELSSPSSSRRSVRISMSQNDSSTSISSATPTSTPSPTSSQDFFSYNDLEREAKAKRLFRKLAKDWLVRKMPSEEQVTELNSYIDVINPQLLTKWREEVDPRMRVEYLNGKIVFNEWPGYPHDQVANLFQAQLHEQFNASYPYAMRRFILDGATGASLLQHYSLS